MLDKTDIQSINKKVGTDLLMNLGDQDIKNYPCIPTGSFELNKALGIGGYPKGRIIEIFGHESSGKTTLTLHAISEAQKNGGTVAFIDAEHALDPQYAKAIGVNTKTLIFAQPDSGEQAMRVVLELINTSKVDLIVVDSVAALVPEAELNGEIGDNHVGLQARMMSQSLRKITGALNKTNTTIIFINQLREKIGVVFGNPQTTPGGRALKFYSSVRIETRKGKKIPGNEFDKGIEMKMKVVKNKMAPPFKEAIAELEFGRGINPINELINECVLQNILVRKGAYYYLGDKKLAQGIANLEKNILEDTKLEKLLRDKLK